jgi:excisionase family DNA binding protein
VADITPWLTVAQAAARAQVSKPTIYTAIRTGKLKAAKLGAGRSVRLLDTWVDEWLIRCAEWKPVEARLLTSA